METLMRFSYTNGKSLPNEEFESCFLSNFSEQGISVQVVKMEMPQYKTSIWRVIGFIKLSEYKEADQSIAEETMLDLCRKVYKNVSSMELMGYSDEDINQETTQFLKERFDV
jgi:hypothetical protein